MANGDFKGYAEGYADGYREGLLAASGYIRPPGPFTGNTPCRRKGEHCMFSTFLCDENTCFEELRQQPDKEEETPNDS